MKRLAIAATTLSALLGALAVALLVACIWTAGREHTSFTQSDKLGATAVVTLIVAVLFGGLAWATWAEHFARKDEASR